jgi:ABC-2 type transport system permease protein
MSETQTVDLTGEAAGPLLRRPSRPFYWSIRRELWENRLVLWAPAGAGALVAFTYLFRAFAIPELLAKPGDSIMTQYAACAFLVLGASLLVSYVFAVSALHGERRDGSILFWKSLPVSDTVTVLAKAAVPIVVLPLLAFALIVGINLAMLAWGTVVTLGSGLAPFAMWSRLELPFMWLVLAYTLPFLALWHAPMFAWLLLVSGWAKRMPLVWAVAPFVALGAVERLTTNSHLVPKLLGDRLMGGMARAFTIDGRRTLGGMADINLARTYGDPGLWIGLLVAAGLLFAAIRLRRARGPI